MCGGKEQRWDRGARQPGPGEELPAVMGRCVVVRRQQALHAPQYHGLQGLGEAKCNMESEASRGNVRESQGEEFYFHVVASA